MREVRKPNAANTLRIACAIVVLATLTTVASAQTREGHWDFSLGTMYQLSNAFGAEGGTQTNTDADFGFAATLGYHTSDRMTLNFGIGWAGVGYNSNIVKQNGTTSKISGTYDTWSLSANALFNLTEGSPVVPYVGAGIGWTWVDSNIPAGLPDTGCWWDPWYGYICYTSYPTYGADAFSYQALAGLRYEFNSRTFMRLGYTSQWLDLSDAANGKPRFDVINLEFGWTF